MQIALAKYRLPATPEQTLIWMDAIDENHDGSVSIEEFGWFMRYAWTLIHTTVESGLPTVAEEERVCFLGGSCNPTTWRHDVSIPLLEKSGVAYYNPQASHPLPLLSQGGDPPLM